MTGHYTLATNKNISPLFYKLIKLTDNKQNMKIRTGVLCFLLGVYSLLSSNGLYGEERVHTVLRGETFYSIARSFGIRAEDLMKFNGISDPSRLQVGQRLKIPDSSAQVTPGQAQAVGGAAPSYRVVKGDTLYSIARKFSVSVASIQEVNSLPSGYVLRIGDSLILPSSSSGPPAGSPASQARAEASSASSSISWPVSVLGLNYMTGKLSGVVITGTRSESVKSLTFGMVLSAGPYRGFGRVVIVQVEGSYLYVYGGCESLSVKEGDKVGPGTELGKLGIDPVSNKPQLFFMVYKSNVPVDPAKAPRA